MLAETLLNEACPGGGSMQMTLSAASFRFPTPLLLSAEDCQRHIIDFNSSLLRVRKNCSWNLDHVFSAHLEKCNCILFDLSGIT